MAKKGNITVNLKTENPLKTILKHGKIPVVRIAYKGFNNYSQKKYFDRYTEEGFKYVECSYEKDVLLNEKPDRGCFVSIGGMQGTWICDGHDCETINIGYVEPETKVYITYVPNGSSLKPFTFVTAKERYEDSLRCFETFLKGPTSKQLDSFMYELSLFDIYSEAIVDSKEIKKCIEISEAEETFDLFHYVNDGYLRIFTFDNLLKRVYHTQVMPTELKELLGFCNAEEFKWTLYNDYECMLLTDE